MEYWAADHPVLRVLRERRAATGTRDTGRPEPGGWSDGHKVGLAIQGGGMRGVVSAAMLTALDDLGFGRVFDAIYGASSGAMNGAYFLSGGSWRHLRIYWDYLNTRDFLDLRRLFRGNVIDLDYAFTTVLRKLAPLDYAAVLNSPTALHVAITLVDQMRTEVVHEFGSEDDLDAALRVSAWLPVAVRGTAEFRGSRALDGAMLTVLPYRLAVADGCTHVLSLSTRPLGRLRGGFSMTERLVRWELDRIHRGLGRAHKQAGHEYRADRATLARAALHPDREPFVMDLAPLPWMNGIRPLDTDPGRLLVSARQAYEIAACALEGRDQNALDAGSFHTVARFVPSDGVGTTDRVDGPEETGPGGST